MRRLHIHHLTTCTYSHAVELLPHTVRVHPREDHDVRIESSRLETTPASMVHRHPEAVPPVVGAFVGQLAHASAMTVNVEVRALS